MSCHPMKNVEEILKVFEQCPDLKTLTCEELSAIAVFANQKEYHKSQEVFSLNHQGNYFYVFIEGQLKPSVGQPGSY